MSPRDEPGETASPGRREGRAWSFAIESPRCSASAASDRAGTDGLDRSVQPVGRERRRAWDHRDVVGAARRSTSRSPRCARSPRSRGARTFATLGPRPQRGRRLRCRAGVSFVTTSAGDPTKLTAKLKALGITVFHVVPSLRARRKAVDRASTASSSKATRAVASRRRPPRRRWCSLPLVASKVDVPLIAAGGICDVARWPRRIRARRRRCADGHAEVASSRSAGAPELETADLRFQRERHRAAEPACCAGIPALRTPLADRLERRSAGRWRSAASKTSTSVVTSRRCSRSAVRSRAASNPCGRSPRSSSTHR